MFMGLLLWVGGVIPVLGFWCKSVLVFWALMEVQLFVIVSALSWVSKSMSQVYFCVNSLSGMLILIGAGVYTSTGGLSKVHLSKYVLPYYSYGSGEAALLIVVGLCVKMGLFPLPFWVPYLVKVSWGKGHSKFVISSMWLLVVSKLMPLMGILHFCGWSYCIFMVLLVNLYISGWGMFGAGSFGEFIGWSSVGGGSIWVFLGWISDVLSMFCFVMYSVVLVMSLWYFSLLWVCFLLFFLMGVPPMSFFLFKLGVIFVLIPYPVGDLFSGSISALLCLGSFIIQMVSYVYYVSSFSMWTSIGN